MAFGKRVTGCNQSSFAFERDGEKDAGNLCSIIPFRRELKPTKEKFDFVSDERINRDKIRVFQSTPKRVSSNIKKINTTLVPIQFLTSRSFDTVVASIINKDICHYNRIYTYVVNYH